MKTTKEDRAELREYDRLRFRMVSGPERFTIPEQGIMNKWSPINILGILLDDIDELEKRLEICEKALGFYADPRKWTSPSGKIGITEIWSDQQAGEHIGSCGQKAVEALAASRKIGEE